MYPLPEQSQPQPARLRPLPDPQSAAPLSAPLAGDLFQPRRRPEISEAEPPPRRPAGRRTRTGSATRSGTRWAG